MKNFILNSKPMIAKKLSRFALISLGFALLTGCVATRGDRTYTNVAGGLYTHDTYSYERVPEATIPLRRINVDPGAEYSGERVSVLWGLFTYYDY